MEELTDKEAKKAAKAKELEEFYKKEFHRTRSEEWANGITHMIGVVFGIVALTLMVVFAAFKGNAWHITSCAIYGATLIMLNFSSTMYHLVSGFTAKRVWQYFDHCTIYFLIAGSYTPFTLVTLRGPCGWTIFGIVWGLTLLGVLLEVTMPPKYIMYTSLPIYVIQGWLIVTAFKSIMATLPTTGLVMLVVGGVVYTLGCIFYVMDNTPYMHTIWHLFVLGGNVCHWVCITFYVIPWSEQ